jgi:hypothetical protein
MRITPCAAARLARLVPALGLALMLSACNGGYLGDQPAASPGTVTLRLLLQSPETFCDQVQPCGGSTHVAIRTDNGHWLRTETGWCATPCSKECPHPACSTIACAGPGAGVEINEIEQTWDGAYLESSYCGDTIACTMPRFALPGHFVARLCATPGALGTSSAGPPTCSVLAPSKCVEVPFDLPGPGLVEATLPSGI